MFIRPRKHTNVFKGQGEMVKKLDQEIRYKRSGVNNLHFSNNHEPRLLSTKFIYLFPLIKVH